MEAPCTSLDELMFDCIVCVMQRPKRRAEHLVSSRQPVFVFLFLLLLTFLHFLFQPEHLEVTWIFDAIMMRSALEHVFFKVLPDCSHEHPNYVPSFVPHKWPGCLINIMRVRTAKPFKLITFGLVLSSWYFHSNKPCSICTHRRYHDRVYVHTSAQSCLFKGTHSPHVYARMGAIVPCTCIHT